MVEKVVVEKVVEEKGAVEKVEAMEVVDSDKVLIQNLYKTYHLHHM